MEGTCLLLLRNNRTVKRNEPTVNTISDKADDVIESLEVYAFEGA